jgi:hypothetical protein
VEDCIRDDNIDHFKRVVIDNEDNNKDDNREWGVRGDHSDEDSGLSKTIPTSYTPPRRQKRKWTADKLAASELSLLLVYHIRLEEVGNPTNQRVLLFPQTVSHKIRLEKVEIRVIEKGTEP